MQFWIFAPLPKNFQKNMPSFKTFFLFCSMLGCAANTIICNAQQAESVVWQNTKHKHPFDGAKVTLLGDTPVDFGMFSSDMVLPWMPLFSDQPYENRTLFSKTAPLPPVLDGKLFYLLPSDRAHEFVCEQAGEVIAVAFAADRKNISELQRLGFKKQQDAQLAFQFQKLPGTEIVIFQKTLAKGEHLKMPARVVLAGIVPPVAPPEGEVLYNGIVLPKIWPPYLDANSPTPPEIPYLKKRPAVVPIDIGRQLFVDDFLIEQTTLTREFHTPKKYEGNPVLKPETELEKKSTYGDCAVAAPLGGSVWWNPEKQFFEIWYEAGHVTNLAYATSKDGLNWERPQLDVFPGTNKILEQAPDSWSVVRDWRAVNPDEKYKLLMRGPDMDIRRSIAYTSPDGIHWNKRALGGFSGDRVTFFYNPFRQKWVYSLRWGVPIAGRVRAYWESDDFLRGAQWLPNQPVFWARTDTLDKQILPGAKAKPQMYNLDACAYESLMLGFFQLHYGPDNNSCAAQGVPKITGLNFAYSRDGFHWDRPDRELAIASTQKNGDWDRGYVQSVGNICAVMGDKLVIYYTAFAGDENKKWDSSAKDKLTAMFASGMHQNGAMGVAFLRRDGFASMNAQAQGTLLTRPVVFTGKHLFVNLEAPQGELLAQLVGMDGKPVAPFTFENCEPLTGDTVFGQIKWKDGSDLSALAGRALRFEFKLKNAKLYAFWVSRDESGRSDGYVAGGGPGFTCDTDTVGKAVLK